jgi:hypothetical protein
VIAAGGLVLTLLEALLPRSAARSAARAAIGLLFLELLATGIIGIFR